MKPIPVRIAVKDQANECALFKPRVTVAREGSSQPANGGMKVAPSALNAPPPKNASDARDAFDRLFKK
jgi:hypothetical protein